MNDVKPFPMVLSHIFDAIQSNIVLQKQVHYNVNPELFARTLFSRIASKDIFATSKFVTSALFTNITKRQSDFAIARGFYFHETSPIFFPLK